jgi:Protein of unknown function (DUF1153)
MARKNLLRGLPPAGTKRWMARRKAAVVLAVRRGLITQEEACRRYELSEEEFSSWQRSFDAHGVNGLRITSLQRYRDGHSRRRARGAPTAATAGQQRSRKPAETGLQQSIDPYLTVWERV